MNKKYIVRLSNDEKEQLIGVTKKLKGSSQKGNCKCNPPTLV